MKQKKVIVAMSGGVDSSVAAALLLEQGYAVEGATLDLGQGGNAAADAAAVCARLGLAHHVLEIAQQFEREVIAPFCDAYLAGLTPNPCVACNPKLKFPAFTPLLQESGADFLATGHYVQLKCAENGRWLLYQAQDKNKDQSYFLYALPQQLLAHCLFPLGGLTKEAVRNKARDLGLSVAEKGDSQDICFIPEGDYRTFLAARLQAADFQPGEIVDTAGKPLGRHRGLAHYTIGQRKGLGLALGYPAYVVAMQAETNRLVVGREEQLYCNEAVCADLHFLPFDELSGPLDCQVKVRYRATPSPAVLLPQQDGLRILFQQPERAVTPGQAAVFYAGEQLVGGGTIRKAI